jgi:hypothetical protein
VALAHITGASTKASLLIQIQEAPHTSETMVLVQLQLGETHQATELAAVTVLVQLQLGETHQATELAAVTVLVQLQLGETLLTQSVLAPDGVANHLAYKTPSLRRGCFICPPNKRT